VILSEKPFGFSGSKEYSRTNGRRSLACWPGRGLETIDGWEVRSVIANLLLPVVNLIVQDVEEG
jgi:hypothetical protein